MKRERFLRLPASLVPLAASTHSPPSFFFSSGSDSSNENPNPAPETTNLAHPVQRGVAVDVEDVGNKGMFFIPELKTQTQNYFKGDERVLPLIDDVNDKEFESDFEELHETDEEIFEELHETR